MIKTEFRGGASDVTKNNTIEITTGKGAIVKLVKDNEVFEQIATEGVAIFNEMQAGVYSVISEKNGISETRELLVTDTFTLSAPLKKMLKDLPLGSKVRVGTTFWKIIDKNHYHKNSVELMNTISVGNSKFSNSSSRYNISLLKGHLENNVYSYFSDYEKSIVLPTSVSQFINEEAIQMVLNIFPPSIRELGSELGNEKEGTIFQYFIGNKDLTINEINSENKRAYFTRSAMNTNTMYFIQNNGNVEHTSVSYELGSCGIISLKDDVILKRELSNDYYVIDEPSVNANQLQTNDLVEIGGVTFKVVDKENQPDCITLFSTQSLNQQTWGTDSMFVNSLADEFLNKSFYSTLSKYEQSAIAEVEVVQYDQNGEKQTFKTKLYPPSLTELGLGTSSKVEGKKLATMSSDNDRITDGGVYYTRTVVNNDTLICIDYKGKSTSATVKQGGINIDCLLNLVNDAKVQWNSAKQKYEIKE